MKLLLINPTRTGLDTYISPPLHLLYIHDAIVRAGHSVEIIDVHYLLFQPQYKSMTKEEFENYMIEKILAEKFDVLGIGSIVSSYHFTKNLAKRAKQVKPDVPIIIGGGMSSALKDLWLNNTQVDYLVESDGELVIQRFLEAYPNSEKLMQVPGLMNRSHGFRMHVKPELPKNLDYIPFPDWNRLNNLSEYMRILKQWVNLVLPKENQLLEQNNVLPIVMTRGCPYKCTFCYHVHNKHRSHSVEYVVKYLKHLRDTFGVDFIVTWDDLIMADPKWFMRLCDEIAAQNLGIKMFTSGGKPNIVTAEMVAKMKKANLIRISYGIESGSQEMLNIMKKGTTVEQNYNAVKITNEAGIFTHLNMVIGMPGESFSTLKETASFIFSLTKQHVVTSENISFSYATGYPGTELFQYMLDKGIVLDVEDYLKHQTGVVDYKFKLSKFSKKQLHIYIRFVLLSVSIIIAAREKKYIEMIKTVINLVFRLFLIMIIPTWVVRKVRQKRIVVKGGRRY